MLRFYQIVLRLRCDPGTLRKIAFFFVWKTWNVKAVLNNSKQQFKLMRQSERQKLLSFLSYIICGKSCLLKRDEISRSANKSDYHWSHYLEQFTETILPVFSIFTGWSFYRIVLFNCSVQVHSLCSCSYSLAILFIILIITNMWLV